MRIYTPGGAQVTSSITNIPGAWNAVPTAAFTATPASTSTITFGTDYTSYITPGTPIKYKISTTYYYGICTAITSGLLTIAGASLGGDVTELYYGYSYRTEQVDLSINGFYEQASDATAVLNQLNTSLIWNKGTAYAVLMKVWSKVHDTGTHGQAQVLINGQGLCSTANGLTIAADATWYSTVVDIATANYDINYGEAIEVTTTKAGNGDAHDLMVSIVFVHP